MPHANHAYKHQQGPRAFTALGVDYGAAPKPFLPVQKPPGVDIGLAPLQKCCPQYHKGALSEHKFALFLAFTVSDKNQNRNLRLLKFSLQA